MGSPRRGYVAYLLRLWQAEEAGNAQWRASLENPKTGVRDGFASLQDLFAFLEKKVCQVAVDRPVPELGETGGDINK